MASVKLRAIWFNLVADPSDSVALASVSDFSRSEEVPAQIVRGAGGRTRLFRRAGEVRSWTLGFRFVTPDQKAWLSAHKGQLMCARDDRGHKVFGTFLAVPVSEWTHNELGDVSITFSELSHSEEV